MISNIRSGVDFEKVHIGVALHLLEKTSKDTKSLNKGGMAKYLEDLLALVKVEPKFKDTV